MRAPISAMLSFATFATLAALAACDPETPATVRVDDAYPAITVYQLWYGTTLIADPIAPGASSATERAVDATDYAYAILAPGWKPSDPSSASAPTSLIAVRSKTPLSAKRGDTLVISVSDATFDGRCDGAGALAQADADFITERIFPGPFAGLVYDAKTCTATPLADDAGASDAPAE